MRRKIEFIKNCPICGSDLDLNVVNVQCKNKNCPAVINGKIINYCNNLRIQQIGHNTLKALSDYGFIQNGIVDLYKLKNKIYEIEKLPNFGKLKARAIINEIESKRELYDYEFFGAIGIQGLSTKTFKDIFKIIKWDSIKNLFSDKKITIDHLNNFINNLHLVNGIGEKKINALVDYFVDEDEFNKLRKLLKEIKIKSSINNTAKPIAVISGFRDKILIEQIESQGYEVSDKWTNKAEVLFVKKGENKTKKELLAEIRKVPIKYI